VKIKEMGAKISSLEEELARKSSSSQQPVAASTSTADAAVVSQLNAKIVALESDLAKAQSSSKGTKEDVIIQAPVDTSAWESKVASLQQREEAIVAILKKFLVEQGYLPQGMANMLLASTVVETLEKSLTNPKAPSDDVTSLKKSISKLEKINLELKKTETDAQKYVAQLTAENDELKQKLLLSDERLFELQESMQSKLDSAKEVAKVLNEKLVVATKPKEVEEKVVEAKKEKKVKGEVSKKEPAAKKEVSKKEAASAVAKKVAAPAASKKETAPATSPKLEFSAAQLQKKTKKELGDLLKMDYGVQDIDGVKVDACLKTDLILALEKFR
jgi:hypothetical protein